jgi:hypothetical protein
VQCCGAKRRLLTRECNQHEQYPPFATYPDAIKKAVNLIGQNKTDDAKRVLRTALSTQIVTQTIIPQPVVNAVESLEKKSRILGRKERPD